MNRCRREGVLLLLAVLLGMDGLAGARMTGVRQVRVAGNTVFSAHEILGWLETKSSRPLSGATLSRDLSLIVENYRREGYLEAAATANDVPVAGDSLLADVSIDLSEGRKSVVGSITVRGARRLSEAELLDRFDLRRGDPLDPAVLEQDIDMVLSRYENVGYPFAQCRVAALARKQGDGCDSLEITLALDEGDPLAIDEIRVEGNHETRASVIVRETRVGLGELYNPVKINGIRGRLNRLNIFSSVSEPELYTHDRKGGILITVKEGSTNTFDGIIGYVPAAASGQTGYLTGLASVAMRNLFGTGRKLSFHWQREDQFTQELGVQYVEPWIFDLPVNVGGGFLQRQQDSTYVRRVVDGKTEIMLSDNLSVSITMSSENVIPTVDTAVNIVSSVYSSSTTTVGGAIQFDTRDDLYSPTSGARYATDYQYGRKRSNAVPPSSGGPSDAAIQRIGLDLEFYHATTSRQVIAIGIHGREIQGDGLDESDMYRFGGTNSLRGYRENQFLGSRIAWTNAEYRFLMARRSFFFGFVDAGYYFRPADDLRALPQVQAFKVGYGFGIRLDTSLGNLGVSFALGQGDSIANGKVHFGIINEF